MKGQKKVVTIKLKARETFFYKSGNAGLSWKKLKT